MTWWSRLMAPFRTSSHRFDSAPRPVDLAIGEMLNRGGKRIGRDDALAVPAVLRARNLLCAISTLPLEQYDPAEQLAPNPLLMQFDSDVPNVVHLAQTIEDLVFEAIAWWRVTGFGFDGYPSRVRRLDPNTVSLIPPKSPLANRSPLPSGIDPRGGVVWVDGHPVPGEEIIRFDSPNPGVLDHCGRSIRRALLIDKAAAMYAEDPRPLDYFTPSENAEDISDDDALVYIAQWRASRKKRATGWIPRSMKYNTVDAPSPADLQLAELAKQATLDVANALGLDPEDLGVSTTSRTYANVIDRRQDRINDVLSPYMRAITDRLSMGDVTKRGYTVRFNLDAYLRSNPTERWATYKTAKELGVLTSEEIRVEEGWGPGAPGESNDSPAPAASQAEDVVDNSNEETDVDNVNASSPAAMTFAAPGREHTFTFAADDVEHAFAADTQKRTVSGVALPYNKVTVKYGLKFRFKPGSLKYADVSRVKHYKDHQVPVGKALSLKDGRQMLSAVLSVGKGATGDELLQLAEDGVYDGLSVGVDFDLNSDDVQLGKDGVYDVLRADLREISTTPMPSFDDARLTRVVASRNEGTAMTDTEPTTATAPASAPATVTLSADQFASLMGRIPVTNPATTVGQSPIVEPRQVVNPTRLTASVTEAAPYRLDRNGNLLPGSHEFSNDLILGLRDGDAAAHDRAMSFVRAQFDVVTTDVNELNPTTNRPDMYVDQRSFKYPVWDAISKGSLNDVTPFTFPKFSSASGLVAAHVEGTEPTSGTFVVTNQTVTPTALSGKAKISRETWDQGGNPQIGNLIWNQMVKGWYEALEAAAVAVLDAASPTGIDFSGTPGLANDDLDQALTAAFASLQFVRGGFTMDKLFTQIDFYKALIAAVAADGRRLYPALGPTNAGGTVSSRFGALDINGVTALPAWALAATGAVAASSYLFDSGAVHGWASTPHRFTIDETEVANVYIGIYGYKATAISDINGVREVIYDPS